MKCHALNDMYVSTYGDSAGLLKVEYENNAIAFCACKLPAHNSTAKITDNIIFLGRLTHDELVQYYNLCDYYVMPSIFEAYGLVFVEALCFGLPCIGNNICAMPEFIQDGQNGLLIYQNDVNELATAMEKMLIDGPAMARYVQENRDYYIDKYSWDSVADRIMQVLRTDGFL